MHIEFFIINKIKKARRDWFKVEYNKIAFCLAVI